MWIKGAIIRWGSRSSTGRGTFDGVMYRCIVAYLRMCALRPPRTTVPAQRTQRMNDAAMRPLAELFQTLVNAHTLVRLY